MLPREVTVRVIRDEPVVLLIHIQQVVVLAVIGDFLLFDESGRNAAAPNFFQKGHVNRSQVEVRMHNTGKVLSSAVIFGTGLECQNSASIDGLQNASHVVQDGEEFVELIGSEPGKAHDVPLGYDHKVAGEECACAGYNKETFGFVHNVLGLIRSTLVDVAQQAVARGRGNLIAGIFGTVIPNVYVAEVQDFGKVLDDIVRAQNGRRNIGLAVRQPNDNGVVLGPDHLVYGGEIQGVLVVRIYSCQDVVGNRFNAGAGVETGNGITDFLDERRLAYDYD